MRNIRMVLTGVVVALMSPATSFANVITDISGLPSPNGAILAAESAGVNSVQAEKELAKKKKILKDSVRKLYEDYTLGADLLKWTEKYGDDPTAWPPEVKNELVRRAAQKSSGRYQRPSSGFDDAEVLARFMQAQSAVIWENVAPALGNLGGLVGLIGSGPKELAVDLVKMVRDAIGAKDEVTGKNVKKLLGKYGKDLDDKLGPDEIKEVLKDLEGRLTAEIAAELKALNAREIGDQAESRSENSISFEAETGILSLTDDTITAVGGSTGHPLVGADVKLPEFMFAGLTTWGEPLPLFTAVGGADVSIDKGSDLRFLSHLPSLVYFGETNTFEGVMPYALDVFDNSSFFDEMERAWGSDSALFPSISILPDVDFYAATNGFTTSAETGFTNSLGIIGIPVSEPPSFLLLGFPLFVLIILTWRRRALTRYPRARF